MTRLLMITLLLGLAWSCAAPKVKPPEGSFYVTPELTYLWDSPRHGGNVMGQLYRGDEVKLLDVGASNWWRVELLRSGQAGWVQKELLDSQPLSPPFAYIKEDSAPLLECPRGDCLPLQMLFRGDQVQRVERGGHGWWRVLAVKSRSLGWLPEGVLTERLEEAQVQTPRKAYYYVAVRKLVLRAEPAAKGAVIRTLRFNDQVQKIEENPQGWFKVRQPASGAVGWVINRYLEALPLAWPRGEAPAKEKLTPFKHKEEPLLQPEFM